MGLDRYEPEEPPARRSDGEPGFDSESAFARFQESYPRNLNWRAAWFVWRRKVRSETVFGEVMHGLEWFKRREWTERLSSRIPYPNNWLENEAWVDVIGRPL